MTYQQQIRIAQELQRRRQQAQQGAMSSIGDMTSTTGNILSMVGNMPGQDSNMALSGIGGGLQGASAGIASGNLGAALGGGIMGLAQGLLRSAQNKSEMAQQEYDRERTLIQDKTVGAFRGYYGKGGEVTADGEEQEIVPIQAEKYNSVVETILLPDLSIVDSKATVKHDKMKSNEITDVVPVGSRVFSAQPNKAIKNDLKEEEDFLGYDPIEYNENKKTKPIKEVLFSELFKKDRKLTPAELLGRVRTKFKTSDREQDVFTEVTNEENLSSRIPYVDRLIALVEKEKLPKRDMKVAKYRDGGKVQSFQDSGLVLDYFGEVDEVFDTQEGVSRNEFDRRGQMYNNLFNRQQLRTGLGTTLGTLTNALQQTYVKPALQTSTYAPQMFERPDNSMLANQRQQLEAQRRASVSALQASGARPAQIAQYLSGAQTGISNAMNDANTKYNLDALQQRRGEAGYRAGIANANIQELARTDNMTTANQNTKFGQMGDTFQRGLQGMGNIDVNRTQVGEQNRKTYFNDLMQSALNKLNMRGRGLQYQIGSDANTTRRNELNQFQNNRTMQSLRPSYSVQPMQNNGGVFDLDQVGMPNLSPYNYTLPLTEEDIFDLGQVPTDPNQSTYW